MEIDNSFLAFLQICHFIKNLPYKRNLYKEDVFCVLKENGGTCSTKHALLKVLAEDLKIPEIQLMLGIFRMNKKNTPRISSVLKKYDLKEIPEAHNYLKIKGEIHDYTRNNSSSEDFIEDLIEEIEISPKQITDFKVQFHKNFLHNYLYQHPEIFYDLEEFWKIREECILALQSK